MSSLLINGGCRFIGAHLAHKCLGGGEEIAIFDIAPEALLPSDLRE